jgi:hypothetical protein
MSRTVKGVLATGIEFNGKVQKDFEIKLGTIGDLVELHETPAGARAAKNYFFQAVALNALRLQKLGDIPKAQITPELLLELTETDMNTLSAAARQDIGERGELFRPSEGSLEDNTGSAETELQLGGSPEPSGAGASGSLHSRSGVK